MKRKIMTLFIGVSLLSSSFLGFSETNASTIHDGVNHDQDKCYIAQTTTLAAVKPKVLRTISTDLDGDGKKESITLIRHSADYAILKVNKFEMVINLIGSGDADGLDIRVIDLIKTDKSKQIEFRELTTDIYTHRELFSYQNEFISLIVLPSPADSNATVSATYDGKGIITHAYVNQTLFTWFYKESFKYDGKKVSHISKSSYTLDTSVTASTVIKLQKSPTDKQMVFKTTKGMKLTFVETNGKGWFKVKNTSGKTGWFFFDDKTDKIQGKPGGEVFKGLPYAG